jgi:hypothetical protein
VFLVRWSVVFDLVTLVRVLQEEGAGYATPQRRPRTSPLKSLFHKQMSPDSPLERMREFIKTHELKVSGAVGGYDGRTKADVFDDIKKAVC